MTIWFSWRGTKPRKNDYTDVWDYTVECAAIVTKAVLSSSQLSKVLSSLRDCFIEQLEYYTSCRFRVDGNLKLCNMALALHNTSATTLWTHENVRPMGNDRSTGRFLAVKQRWSLHWCCSWCCKFPEEKSHFRMWDRKWREERLGAPAQKKKAHVSWTRELEKVRHDFINKPLCFYTVRPKNAWRCIWLLELHFPPCER